MNALLSMASSLKQPLVDATLPSFLSAGQGTVCERVERNAGVHGSEMIAKRAYASSGYAVLQGPGRAIVIAATCRNPRRIATASDGRPEITTDRRRGSLRLAQPAELNRAPSKHPTHSRWRDHAALPIGTLTFLLTNIEGSTWMWQAAGDAMQIAL